MLNILAVIKLVNENTCDLNFVSWSCRVDKVIEDVYLLLSWNTTWRDGARCLLDSPFLIVSVHGHVLLVLVRPLGLANNALAKVLLWVIHSVVIDWSLNVSALLAAEEELLELRENLCSLSDDSSDFDESVQVALTEVSELVVDW